jgi:esterase/lipase superfamily enzyme
MRSILIVLLIAVAAVAHAAEYDYCARGVGDEFTKTTRVHLSIDGPEPGHLTSGIARELINRLVWKGRARESYVEPYHQALCEAALGERNEIIVSLTKEELDRFAAELDRGPAEKSPTAQTLANRATASIDLPSVVIKGNVPYVTLRVFYATNRKGTGSSQPKEQFGSDRSETLSYGAVEVTIPKQHTMGEIETPSIFRLEFYEDPEKHITLQAVRPLNEDAWRRELRARATAFNKPGVLLFIHGYNVSFDQAAIRTGQLAYDLGFEGAATFFSWPSQGETLHYNADQTAAEWSILDMQKVLAELGGLAPGTPVYVVAHSMGNRVLTRAFERLISEEPVKRRAYREIVLTAPDIDADIFRNQIAPKILGVGPRVTLYASSSDRALLIARSINAGYRRLGEAGNDIPVIRPMDTVDASSVKTDFLTHSYFGDSSTLMSDLFYLIRKGLNPGDRFGLERMLTSSGAEYWRFKKATR